MRWTVKYVNSRDEEIAIECKFQSNAMQMMTDLLEIGFCSWVETTEADETPMGSDRVSGSAS